MEHSARIVEIAADEKRIDVNMTVSSACGSCKAKEVCGQSDSEQRIVSVYEEHPEIYEVGQEVTVFIERIMGVKAITYSYILPFFLMLVTLFATNQFGDLVSGLATLGACALYYIVLFFFRDRIEKVIVFRIKHNYF